MDQNTTSEQQQCRWLRAGAGARTCSMFDRQSNLTLRTSKRGRFLRVAFVDDVQGEFWIDVPDNPDGRLLARNWVALMIAASAERIVPASSDVSVELDGDV